MSTWFNDENYADNIDYIYINKIYDRGLEVEFTKPIRIEFTLNIGKNAASMGKIYIMDTTNKPDVQIIDGRIETIKEDGTKNLGYFDLTADKFSRYTVLSNEYLNILYKLIKRYYKNNYWDLAKGKRRVEVDLLHNDMKNFNNNESRVNSNSNPLEIQETQSTEVFPDTIITCKRCNGNGYIPEYRHIQNGVCFSCWGSGTHSFQHKYPKLNSFFREQVESDTIKHSDILSIIRDFEIYDTELRQAEIQHDLDGIGYYTTKINELITKAYKLKNSL